MGQTGQMGNILAASVRKLHLWGFLTHEPIAGGCIGYGYITADMSSLFFFFFNEAAHT